MIVTFYSYKGGAGRTMAMANVAAQLASLHGYQVLAIDWDLEAPGLHYYFGLTDKDLENQVGLLDLLERASRGDVDFNLADYTIAPPRFRPKKGGGLHLLTCGRLDRSYMRRLARFDWSAFYDEHNGRAFLEKVRGGIEERFAISLIDSRAGQSDTNVPPTCQLADLLVMLFTSNDQSMAGTEALCERFQLVREKNRGRSRVPIILAPSRVFSDQPGYQKWIKEIASPSYNRLLEKKTLLRSDQPNGLEQVVLEIDAQTSIGEQLPVLDRRRVASKLVQNYQNLVELILARKHNEDMLWKPERVRNHGAFDEHVAGKLREDLKTASSRGDEIGGALTGLRLARTLKELSPAHAAEARSLATTSLTVFRIRQDRSLQALALHTLGQVAAGVQDYKEAQEHYEKALACLGEDERSPRAIIYHDLGVALVAMRHFSEAEKTIRRSLELKGMVGDVAGQAMSTHQLGNLELSRRNLDRAIELFEEARRLAEQANDRLGAAFSSHQIGNVYAQRKEWASALTWFQRALAIHAASKDMRGSGITRRRIGDVLERLGKLDEAEMAYREALSSAHAEGDLRNQQTLHRRLSQILLQAQQYSEARTEATTALRLAEGIALKPEVVKNLLLLAEIELDAGNLTGADRYVIDAEGLAETAPETKERAAAMRKRIESRRDEAVGTT